MKSQSREARLNIESSKSQFCGMKGRKSHFLYIISVVSMDEKSYDDEKFSREFFVILAF